ncbi:hypothetical protein FRACA_1560009 [Frankia canadensis]|uniref:Uncharacterized protein n=1 Tax=Frankia canadensis TaxID=1836972 RepID=A0A2I2KMC0_9ACTN|nr:hypothetical protein FRACA_1560009 [Frankia canadensis]SOU54089.1 hypothetical protein FRACA_1560009 [Frankia canadensis]
MDRGGAEGSRTQTVRAGVIAESIVAILGRSVAAGAGSQHDIEDFPSRSWTIVRRGKGETFLLSRITSRPEGL